MARWRVVGAVYGSKYLGVFEADTKEKAEELAMEGETAHVSLCNQCADQCDDPTVERAEASPMADDEEA